MSRKSRRQLPDFARAVVQAHDRTREQAAWELLEAIASLFPDRIAGLRKLGDSLSDERIDDLDEEDPHNKAAEDRFWNGVRLWTAKNNISSEAVDAAAAKYAVGDIPSTGIYLGLRASGRLIEPPSLTAYPHDQTREEFLEKASRYYDDVVRFYVDAGASYGAIKRELEHFRWLVAHLTGGYSFARIADGDNPFHLSAKSAKTVAGESRKLARLIGIELPSIPGPRQGRRIRKGSHRAKR